MATTADTMGAPRTGIANWRVWRLVRNRRRRPPLLPLLVLVAFVVMAALPGLLAPHDPTLTSLSNRLKPPVWLHGTSSHILGTDQLGRDIFSRIIYGARTSLQVSISAILIGGSIGLLVGMIAGYMGGWTGMVLMRLVDAALAIPLLLVALLLAVALGPSLKTVIIIISLLIWAGYARILRGDVLTVRERDYVTAAVSMGASTPRILIRHILPNIMPTLIVLVTLQVGSLILLEASLSFLGAGVPPPAPTWGGMVNGGRDVILTSWWVSFFPGLAILMTVLAFNLLGDWLRDVLDPRVRKN